MADTQKTRRVGKLGPVGHMWPNKLLNPVPQTQNQMIWKKKLYHERVGHTIVVLHSLSSVF